MADLSDWKSVLEGVNADEAFTFLRQWQNKRLAGIQLIDAKRIRLESCLPVIQPVFPVVKRIRVVSLSLIKQRPQEMRPRDFRKSCLGPTTTGYGEALQSRLMVANEELFEAVERASECADIPDPAEDPFNDLLGASLTEVLSAMYPGIREMEDLDDTGDVVGPESLVRDTYASAMELYLCQAAGGTVPMDPVPMLRLLEMCIPIAVDEQTCVVLAG